MGWDWWDEWKGRTNDASGTLVGAVEGVEVLVVAVVVEVVVVEIVVVAVESCRQARKRVISLLINNGQGYVDRV